MVATGTRSSSAATAAVKSEFVMNIGSIKLLQRQGFERTERRHGAVSALGQ